jgi:hypothetical protein
MTMQKLVDFPTVPLDCRVGAVRPASPRNDRGVGSALLISRACFDAVPKVDLETLRKRSG